MRPSRVRLHQLPPASFRAVLPELLTIYVAAMNYPAGTAGARAALWADHARRDGFRAVAATDVVDASDVVDGSDTGTIIGLAYGYMGRPGQWWHDEVARGLRTRDGHEAIAPHIQAAFADYFELTELHVHPDHQGDGTGEALLRSLVAPLQAGAVLLSTPEGENRAWRLYRRLGFFDVLRHFLFTGDARPFAVLGRTLPLDDARR